MRKILITLIFFFFAHAASGQLLIDSIPFPSLNVNFWGLGEKGDTLLLGDDFNGPISFMTKDGAIHRTLTTPYTFNHGTAWTGSSYLIAEDFQTIGTSLLEIDLQGNEINDWIFPLVVGGNTQGVGGLHYNNGDVWYTMYFPDFNTYPFSYAYRWTPGANFTSDTIPLRGEQPYGLTFKGDTLLYVTDNLNGDLEKIYAYHASIDDTLFSFDLPDTPIDNDMSPRGLQYDGKHLWMMANRQGGSAFAYRTLYKYGIEPYAFMEIDNQELHFGDVNLTETASMAFNITNIGQQDLVIESILGSTSAFEVTDPSFPQAITAGNSLEIEFSFTPTSIGFQEDLFTITSNDIIQEMQHVVTTGIGIESTGIEDVNQSHFSIQPNPSTGVIQIELAEQPSSSRVKLEIVGLIGKVVHSEALNQRISTIKLIELPNGMYLARLIENNQLIASKKLHMIR